MNVNSSLRSGSTTEQKKTVTKPSKKQDTRVSAAAVFNFGETSAAGTSKRRKITDRIPYSSLPQPLFIRILGFLNTRDRITVSFTCRYGKTCLLASGSQDISNIAPLVDPYLTYVKSVLTDNNSHKKLKEIKQKFLNDKSMLALEHSERIHELKNKIFSLLKKALANKSGRESQSQVIALMLENEKDYSLADVGDVLENKESALINLVTKNPLALQHLSKEHKRNYKIVMAAVKVDGYALCHASSTLKIDKTIVLAAVKQCGTVIFFAHVSMKSSKTIALAAVSQNGLALEAFSKEIKQDKTIVRAAVQQNGCALEYADVSLKSDLKTALMAVKQNGFAICDVIEALKDNEVLVIAAIKQNPKAIQFASPRLLDDPKTVLVAIKGDPLTLRFASNNIKKNRRIVLAAYDKDPDSLKYAHEHIRINYKTLFEEERKKIREENKQAEKEKAQSKSAKPEGKEAKKQETKERPKSADKAKKKS
ncbi:MAG: DUF4116 domain-containing protein [Parachlamydiaceae bacterium]|nr:DUF4116 domain-containing protein [Parachlamydiaceae bacterium]